MINQLKILILMSYYNRPLLVKNSLQSILKSNEFHQNWVLFFGDDGSFIPGKPIVEEILHNHLDKVKFENSHMSLKEKINSGLVIGKYANEAIKQSDADVAIILCDDDELVPTYLAQLNSFLLQNPDILYCYSKVYVFNPLLQKSDNIKETNNKYNQWNGPINPVGKVDASQVAWRLKCCKEYDAWFPDSTKLVKDKPWVADTDRSFFDNLFKKCGDCQPTDLFCQFKGIHDYQLLWHKNATEESLIAYDAVCRQFAGAKF
jgi:hypothetical protein